MKHTIKLLTLAAILTAVFGLTGCPGPVNNYIEPPHEHVFGDWGDWEVVTAATCIEDGSKKRTRTCSCGEVEEETAIIVKLGHDFGEWGEWAVTVQPTTTSVGKKVRTRTCKRVGCNHSETWEETIPMLTSDPSDTGDDDTSNDSGDTNNTTEENDTSSDTTEEHNYVGGGCDECGTFEFNGEDDYQIIAYVYSSKEDAQNSENETVLYFSFPHDTTGISQIAIGNNGPKITIDNLIQMKNGYNGKTVKYFAYESNDFTIQIDDFEYKNWSENLEDLDSGSPLYIVVE